MTECPKELVFSSLGRRQVLADFLGGAITSDAGALLLREADRRLGLTAALAACIPDPRDPAKVEHSVLEMLRQRVYSIAMGYEDLNDQQSLRQDALLKLLLEKDGDLASPPTLCRFENRLTRASLFDLSRVFVEQFIQSHAEPPAELVLDFDATEDEVHGRQQGRFFHGFYDCYCFLPLYVFCGDRLLVSYLRPSKIDGAKHAWAILALLVKRFRQAWPGVKIVLRGDSGFCRRRMLRWCDRQNVGYVVGLAQNTRLLALSAGLMAEAKKQFERDQTKARLFGELDYAAKKWDRPRRVIIKAEHSQNGENPRFLVTNLAQPPQELYEKMYCARGEMENRIKEQQLDLFADRTSAHLFLTNQFRLILASVAYTLLEYIRSHALKGTELARAQCGTIRLKLLKIGARIVSSVRRIVIHLASAYPYAAVLNTALQRLKPS